MVHAGAAEVVQLGKGLTLMITLLVCSGEQRILVRNHVILQLSHSLELHARGCLEGFFGPHERGVRSAVEGLAAFVEEAAQEAQGGNLVKGIHKGGAVTRNDVKVAVASLDERREKAGAVHALPFREHGLGIFQAVYRKIQGFHASVLGRIHEIYHANVILHNKGEHIFAGKGLRILLKESNNLIGIQCYFFIHYAVLV